MKKVHFEASDSKSGTPSDNTTPASAFKTPQSFLEWFKASESLTEISFKGLQEIGNFHFYYLGWNSKSSKCESVKTLDISYCPNISDTGIIWIAKCFPKIKMLIAKGCSLLTENSARFLAQCKNVETGDLNETLCRYIPLSCEEKSKSFSFAHCPLMTPSPLPNGLSAVPKPFTDAKVVIIKSNSFQNISLAAKLFGDVICDATMDTAGSTVYRLGTYALIECLENSAAQLLLSNNCLVVLPYDTSITIVQQLRSVQDRLMFTLSILELFKVAVIPAWFLNPSKKDHRNKKLKSMKEILIGNLSGAPPPADELSARYKFFVENYLEFTSSKEELLVWVEKNKPHSDVSPSINSSAFEEVMQYFSEPKMHFSSLNSFVKSVRHPTDLDGTKVRWASVVQILVETGNLWREQFIGFDSPIPGPSHIVSTLVTFTNFLTELRTGSHSSAMNEDIRCLPAETTLCSTSHLHDLLVMKDGTMMETSVRDRLFYEFEFFGLGIFRTASCLPLSSLPEKPAVDVKHFIVEFSDHLDLLADRPYFCVHVKYPLATEAEVIFQRLLAVLAKVFPPTLIWNTGAFFYDAFFLEILLKADKENSAITVQFTADMVCRRTDVMVSVCGTCSVFHTICCLVLNPFSFEDLFNLETPRNIEFINPCQVDHSFTKGKFRAFSRRYDDSTSRCCNCLFDPLFSSCLERLFIGQVPNASVQRLMFALGKSFSHSNPGFTPTMVEIPDASGIKAVSVQGDNDGSKMEVSLPDSVGKSALDFEWRRLDNGKLFVGLSVDSLYIAEKQFESSTTVISILLDSSGPPKPTPFHYRNAALPQNRKGRILQRLDGFDEFFHTPKPVQADQLPEVGMRLEARNMRHPNLLCVASIAKVKDDGSCLINLDGLSSGFGYWTKLDAEDNNLFPCGFVEFLNKHPEKLAQFKESTPKFPGTSS